MPCIYVIAEKGAPDGLVKIGFSSNTSRRLKELQLTSLRELTIEYKAEVAEEHVQDAERIAHTLLADKHIRSEWFDVAVDEAIAAVNAAIVQTVKLTPWNKPVPSVITLKFTPEQMDLLKMAALRDEDTSPLHLAPWID
jgi:hypothetical protein